MLCFILIYASNAKNKHQQMKDQFIHNFFYFFQFYLKRIVAIAEKIKQKNDDFVQSKSPSMISHMRQLIFNVFIMFQYLEGLRKLLIILMIFLFISFIYQIDIINKSTMQKSQHECENEQHQNVPTTSNALIPIVSVNGSNEFLVSGIAYAIKNAHHGGFLHAGGSGGTGDRSFVQNGGAHSSHRQWVIERNANRFSLRNVRHNTAYLHPGGQGGTGDRAFVQNGIHAEFQHWNFEHRAPNRIGIRNVRHSAAFLHSGERAGTGDRAFVQNGIDRLFQLWEFQPQRFDMRMRIADFTYLDNAQQLVRDRTDVRFISQQIFDVDAGTVGSSLQHTFTSTVSESFSWSLNQSLNVSISLEVSAGLPLGVGSATRTISASATVGSQQTWQSSQSTQFSVAGILIPNQPGRFEMTGFTDVVNNLELRYTAIGEVTVLGPRMTNQGGMVENQSMPADAIISYLRFAFRDIQVIERRQNSVIVRVSGVMRSTYGLRSHFTSRQIA